MQDVLSWGRLGPVPHEIRRPAFLDEARNAVQSPGRTRLCFGLGRSYGDVCLNADGRLIVTDTLDRIISFDRAGGILRAEAGLSLDRLLRVAVPAGWFPPVVPGTKFVTLGGAVANDVHGKNHEAVGTFGAHVIALGLARSDGQMLTLTRTENAELFAATIGGLGLTGVILWVELQLAPIRSAIIDSETLRLKGLADFFRVSENSARLALSVAWIDCLAKGSEAGRGFYIRGRHAESGGLAVHRAPRLAVPLDAPGWLVNTRTIGLFNSAYLHRPFVLGAKRVHYEPFFFPLDAWRAGTGSTDARVFPASIGVPTARAFDTLRKLLELTAEFGEGSFLWC